MNAESLENLAFLLNVNRLDGCENFEIAPGHFLRRAARNEHSIIEQSAAHLPLPLVHRVMEPMTFWRCSFEEPSEVLPIDDWRYFVVAFRGNSDTLSRLEKAFALCEPEVEFGFTAMRSWGSGSGLQVHEPSVYQFLSKTTFPTVDAFVTVSERHAQEAQELAAYLASDELLLQPFNHAAAQFVSLRMLPRGSHMRFLGLFAILESLITHQPKPSDPYDSITRQVKTKLALLNKRFSQALDYAAFGTSSPDSVWSRMYGYRSTIAHGGTADFTKGELKGLGEPSNALRLLSNAVKATIRQGLREPQLVTDLKNC